MIKHGTSDPRPSNFSKNSAAKAVHRPITDIANSITFCGEHFETAENVTSSKHFYSYKIIIIMLIDTVYSLHRPLI